MKDTIPEICRVAVCVQCGCYKGPLGDWFESPGRPFAHGSTKDALCPVCAKSQSDAIRAKVMAQFTEDTLAAFTRAIGGMVVATALESIAGQNKNTTQRSN